MSKKYQTHLYMPTSKRLVEEDTEKERHGDAGSPLPSFKTKNAQSSFECGSQLSHKTLGY
jgi:hypothetical protein